MADDAYLTQEAVEVAGLVDPVNNPARVTQTVVEAVVHQDTAGVNATQSAVEVAYLFTPTNEQALDTSSSLSPSTLTEFVRQVLLSTRAFLSFGPEYNDVTSTAATEGARSTGVSTSLQEHEFCFIGEASGRRAGGGLQNATDPAPDLYNDGDFQLALRGTRWFVYESGSSKGIVLNPAGDNDRACVRRTSANVVEYYLNDVLVYTSLVTPAFDLRGDIFFEFAGTQTRIEEQIGGTSLQPTQWDSFTANASATAVNYGGAADPSLSAIILKAVLMTTSATLSAAGAVTNNIWSQVNKVLTGAVPASVANLSASLATAIGYIQSLTPASLSLGPSLSKRINKGISVIKSLVSGGVSAAGSNVFSQVNKVLPNSVATSVSGQSGITGAASNIAGHVNKIITGAAAASVANVTATMSLVLGFSLTLATNTLSLTSSIVKQVYKTLTGGLLSVAGGVLGAGANAWSLVGKNIIPNPGDGGLSLSPSISRLLGIMLSTSRNLMASINNDFKIMLMAATSIVPGGITGAGSNIWSVIGKNLTPSSLSTFATILTFNTVLLVANMSVSAASILKRYSLMLFGGVATLAQGALGAGSNIWSLIGKNIEPIPFSVMASVSRDIYKMLFEGLVFTVSFSRRFVKELFAVIVSIADSMLAFTRQITLSATAAMISPSFMRQVGKTLDGTGLSVSAIVSRPLISKVINAVAVTTPSVLRNFTMVMEATMRVSATVLRAFSLLLITSVVTTVMILTMVIAYVLEGFLIASVGIGSAFGGSGNRSRRLPDDE